MTEEARETRPQPGPPLRVAMLFDGNELYGLPQAVINLLDAIDRRRVHTTGIFLGPGTGLEAISPRLGESVCLRTGPIYPLRRPGGIKYDPLFLAGRGIAALRSVRAVRALLEKCSFDVLHTHTLAMARVSWWASRGRPMARLLHYHGANRYSERWWRSFTQWVLRSGTHLAAISQFVRASLPSALRDRTTVVYNGVPTQLLRDSARPGEFRRRFGIPAHAPLVGIFGAVAPIKGHTYFIEAAARVAPELPDVRFAVVGGTTDAYEKRGILVEMHRQIERLGLKDRVIDTGFLPDATRYMTDFDVIAMPSIYTETQLGEGFGMVMIEAMAQGVATISTTCGAPPEVIEHGVSGLLVPPKDSVALGEAMLSLLRNADLRRRMGEAGARRVQQHFDSRVSAAQLTRLYEVLAAARRPVGVG